MISPKCFCHCSTCAVSADGPQTTQNPNHIAIHSSRNLGNRHHFHRQWKHWDTVVMKLWCRCASPMTNLSQCNRAYSCSSVASHSGQLFQQAVDCLRHLSPQLCHHLREQEHNQLCATQHVIVCWSELHNSSHHTVRHQLVITTHYFKRWITSSDLCKLNPE